MFKHFKKSILSKKYVLRCTPSPPTLSKKKYYTGIRGISKHSHNLTSWSHQVMKYLYLNLKLLCVYCLLSYLAEYQPILPRNSSFLWVKTELGLTSFDFWLLTFYIYCHHEIWFLHYHNIFLTLLISQLGGRVEWWEEKPTACSLIDSH